MDSLGANGEECVDVRGLYLRTWTLLSNQRSSEVPRLLTEAEAEAKGTLAAYFVGIVVGMVVGIMWGMVLGDWLWH